MILQVRPGTREDKKLEIVAQFYREQIRSVLPNFAAGWALIMGVEINKFYIQKLKTKWGSCNPRARAIRLNTELAKKPKHCLESIIVHEMMHFLMRHHNDRFICFMDKFMPHGNTIARS
jgi:predicted metal-dependent hydrolase